MPRIPLRLPAAALALLALTGGGSARAQTADQGPLLLSHAGRLLDDQDQPVNARLRLTFTLYAKEVAPAAGSGDSEQSLWSETYDVTVTNGAYAVTLGRGGSGNHPLTRTMFDGDRYLSVRVNDGAEMSPRLRVGSVPRAAAADNVLRAGQPLFDDTGRFLGPTDNLDANRLQGHVPADFAPAVHDHDAQYLKLSDAVNYALKSDVTAALGSYYDKTSADQKLGEQVTLLNQKISALDQKIAALDQTYVTKAAAQAFATTSDVAQSYLSKTDAAAQYAPKNETLPVGTLVLNEDPSDATLDAAGFKLFGSLPSGWATRPASPLATYSRARGAYVDGRVYFPGGALGASSTGYGCTAGSVAVNRVQLFNTRTNGWAYAPNLALARYGHSVLSVNGKIYAVGGITCGNAYTAVTEVYTPPATSWQTINPVPGGHSHTYGAAAELNGKLYVVGGFSTSGAVSAVNGVLHVLDPATGTWDTKATLPRALHSAVAGVIDGKLYVTSGVSVVSGVSNLATETWEYDPQADAWTQKAALPAPVRSAAAAVIAGKLHLFGGLTNATSGASNYISNAHWVYDPSDDSWTSAELMPWTAYGASAVSIGTRAFVAGGYLYNASAYAYQATNAFGEYSAGLYIYRKE